MTGIELTPEVASIFEALLGENRYFLSGTPYRRSKKKHIITTNMSRSDDLPYAYIRVIYDATDVVDTITVPVEDRKEEDFLEHVLQLSGELELFCNVEFVFPEADEDSLWFPLPSRIDESGDGKDVFEILGVRAARLPEEPDVNSGYNFTLDRTAIGEVLLDLYFSVANPFTQELPILVVNESLRIASRLVGDRTLRKRTSK